MTRRVTRQSGMTRVDFVVGVGVLALLVSIAGVPGSAGDARLLEIADARIRSAVDLASGLARSTGTAHGVAFDVEGDRVAVLDAHGELVDEEVAGRPPVTDLGQGRLATYVDLVSARFGPAGTVCVFDGEGVPMAGGVVRLAAGLHRRELVLDGATGWVETSVEVLEEPR